MFLDSGTILVQVDRDGDEQVFSAKSGGEATEIPLVVLVNRFSASGSEVLSAALQDNGRATLIGEKTFGKGTVNVPHKLSDDSGALFVTVARWLTPDRVRHRRRGHPPRHRGHPLRRGHRPPPRRPAPQGHRLPARRAVGKATAPPVSLPSDKEP